MPAYNQRQLDALTAAVAPCNRCTPAGLQEAAVRALPRRPALTRAGAH